MKPTAHPPETIAEIRRKRSDGAKVKDLAEEYFVHYRTIENYCKGIKVRKGA